MENNICYVFGAGEHYEAPPAPGTGDYIIAADGGLDYLNRQGISPDLAIGDFDSCKAQVNGISTIVLPREKDNTDMEAALEAGLEKGFKVFHIYGGAGGRIDHTIANIQCLAALAEKGARGYLHDRDNIITAVKNGGIYFGEDARGYISVFAYSEKALGVCERGLKYPLEGVTLHNIKPLGVSNEFQGEPGQVSVREGTIIVVYPKDVREISA